jgi:hypothetical protein
MSPDIYASVDKAWPATIPPITRIEAARAAARLAKAFKGSWRPPAPARRCWIALSPPYDSLDRGWRRLVHDVSHILFEQQHRRARRAGTIRPHGGFHAALEREMAEYVVSHGWLDGTLRPKPPVRPTPPSPAEARAAKLAAARLRLATWERKRKLAEGKVRKLTRSVRALERRAPPPPAAG